MLNPRSIGFSVCAAAGLLLISAGCKNNESGGDSASSGVTPGEITIGHYGSFTGTTATFGISGGNGIKQAIDEANAAGGVDGKKIKLIVEDDQSKPDVARNVATKLVTQDKVLAVLGEISSTRCMAGAPVCQEHGVPMISPGATNPDFTKMGTDIFRVCFTDDFQAAVVAHFAKDQGFTRMAIYKDNKNDYSMAFATVFAREFTKLGGHIVAEQTFQEGDTDFKVALNSLAGAKPDAILVPGYYSEVGTIGRQAREVGLKCPLMGGDGWDSPQLLSGAGAALEGCFFADHYFSPELKDPLVQNFFASYKKRFGQNPDALSALGYDAGRLLVDALKRAKPLTHEGVRAAIAATKDFPGVTGKITIDANRNARKNALILQVKGNVFHIFKTYTPEQIGQ